MRHVANVNGVSVYSDLAINSIVNGRINFEDGSWCDASTGQVSKKDNGSIILKRNGQVINQDVQEVEEEEQSSIGPQAYRTSILEVRGLEADVEIQPCDGSEMIVTISGPKSGVESVDVAQEGENLVLSSQSTQGGNTIYKTQKTRIEGPLNLGTLVIEGERTILGSLWEFLTRLITVLASFFRPSAGSLIQIVGQSQADVKVRIDVPKGSDVRIINVKGGVQVGDVHGPFSGSVDSIWKMQVGKVGKARLSTSGTGGITVQEVNGDLTMNVQSMGAIKVAQGNVQALTAKTSGTGGISFGGKAQSANLTATSRGGIDVANVKTSPQRKQTGTGKITVRNW